MKAIGNYNSEVAAEVVKGLEKDASKKPSKWFRKLHRKQWQASLGMNKFEVHIFHLFSLG